MTLYTLTDTFLQYNVTMLTLPILFVIGFGLLVMWAVKD